MFSSLSGASETISEGFKLRVDKSAGKNIILSLSAPIPCDWSSLKLRLAAAVGDSDDSDDTFKMDPSGVKARTDTFPVSLLSAGCRKLIAVFSFHVQSSDDGFRAEVTVKLLSHGRSVAFDAAVTTMDHTTEIYGRSVHFVTHNSGPPSKKRKLSAGGQGPAQLSVSPPESVSVSPSAQAGGMSPQHTSPNSDSIEIHVPPAPASEWTHVNSNLQVNGVARARGYITYSDMRLKTSIEDIVDAMHIVCSLKAHKFEWFAAAPCPFSLLLADVVCVPSGILI